MTLLSSGHLQSVRGAVACKDVVGMEDRSGMKESGKKSFQGSKHVDL